MKIELQESELPKDLIEKEVLNETSKLDQLKALSEESKKTDGGIAVGRQRTIILPNGKQEDAVRRIIDDDPGTVTAKRESDIATVDEQQDKIPVIACQIVSVSDDLRGNKKTVRHSSHPSEHNVVEEVEIVEQKTLTTQHVIPTAQTMRSKAGTPDDNKSTQ